MTKNMACVRDELPENDHTLIQVFSHMPNSTIKCLLIELAENIRMLAMDTFRGGC